MLLYIQKKNLKPGPKNFNFSLSKESTFLITVILFVSQYFHGLSLKLIEPAEVSKVNNPKLTPQTKLVL